MKKKCRAVREHVRRRQFRYGVAVGLSAGLWLTMRNASVMNEFLKEHDLFDEFYALEEV